MDNNEHPPKIDDLTRRQWILRLGELVALAGVSGTLPEFAAAFGQKQGLHVAALPPGLYEASQDHLVHALSSGGKHWSPPPGSETEFLTPTATPYVPQSFSTEEFKVVIRMIEIFLGRVDPVAVSEAAQWLDYYLYAAPAVRNAARQLDPLHRILAVAYYGADSVREVENYHPDATARVGLCALHDLSTRLYGRDFLQLTEAEQVDLLRTAAKAEAGTEDHKFFNLTRTQTIRAYYTSAQGLEELDYRGNAYYTESPGCQEKG
jgi:hypothetical protein